MVLKNYTIPTDSYSSGARFTAVLGKDGSTIATTTNPLPVDAIVSVDSMEIKAEMKVNTGHDLYKCTTVTRTGDLAVSFDSVSGLALEAIQAVENKTQGWVYITKGATVTATTLALVAGNQETGYPVIGVSDEIEIVYRGASRLTDKTQMSQITDGTTEVDVIGTINSLKTDVSSIAGTATITNGGNRGAGVQTMTLADDDPAVTSLAVIDGWDVEHSSPVSVDGVQLMYEAADFDLSALPNDVSEGDAVRPKTTLYGVPYGFLVNEDGSKTVIATDERLQTALPEIVNVGGEYRATATTYGDGDATILQSDVNGNLKVTNTNTEYTDDSAEFVVATDKGNAMMAIATSDPVDSGDVGALRMTVARNLGIDIVSKGGAAWAVNNAINTTIGDGTTIPVVETAGTKKALNVNVTDGTNDMPTMDAQGRPGFVTVTDGSREVDIIDTINSMKTDLSSVAGTAASVSYGVSGNGVQRVAVARDARGYVLRSTHFSPGDGSVAYTSNVTVTCSGFPFTVADGTCTVTYIQIKPTGSTWGAPYINGQDGVSLVASANVITIAGAGTPFASGDSYRLGILYQDKAFTAGTNSLRAEEISPLSQQYAFESLVDTTNVAASAYYPSATGMSAEGYSHFSVTGKLITATGTNYIEVHGTNDEDTTNADWITLYGWDVKNNTWVNQIAAASGTTTYAWDFEHYNFRHIRVYLVVADAVNTTIIKCARKAV